MKRNVIIIFVATVLVLIVGALIWYYSRANSTADEAPPNVTTKPEQKPTRQNTADEPTAAPVERSGTFSPRNNEIISGSASLIGNTIRLNKDFTTQNGPDLFLFIGNANERTVEIAPLKAANGAQNYELPAGTDPASVTHVWIYCRAFNLDFGVASLS